LSFNKGDRLLVLDDTDVDWWLAKNLSNNAKGYIPRNYVAVEVLETEE
jgi:tyrosine-protein kinase Src